MRKLSSLLVLLAMTLALYGVASAATHVNTPVKKIQLTAPKGSNPAGKFSYIKVGKDSNPSLQQYKAVNKLSYATNQKLKNTALAAKKNSYVNGTIDTVPYFSSWFITGSRNSVYPYAMVGQSPTTGGTTTISNRILPLEIQLADSLGNVLFDFNPWAATDPQGSDLDLLAQSPLYDATTTYPGPPADTGQMLDTAQRVEFRTSRKANWHTVLGAPQTDVYYGVTLDPTAWSYLVDSYGDIVGVAIDLNVASSIFELMLQIENSYVPLPNSTVPIILTDYVSAYIPGGGCCVLGYHTAETGIADPNGILVWTWGTFIPQNPDNGWTNPFGAFGSDTMVLTHELSELFNDPFVNTNVSPWIDGSASFAQANLETGDTIEGMAPADAIYNVGLNTAGGFYNYSLQNVATLEWFTRNPFSGGIYSWPNVNTLGQSAHPSGCNVFGACFSYGEGSAAFYFGPPY